MKTYRINEVFYSLQGEGIRVGTANVFVRFTGCNLRCQTDPGAKSPGGFDCDTEFESGRSLSCEDILGWIMSELEGRDCHSIVFTGGEPGLQLDCDIIDYFKSRQWFLCVETNGSIGLPDGIGWITVSPKVAEHAINQKTADEVKYVRGYGQALPKTVVQAGHKLISPAFNGLEPDQRALEWCVQLVKENPDWRLSPQLHKSWIIR